MTEQHRNKLKETADYYQQPAIYMFGSYDAYNLAEQHYLPLLEAERDKVRRLREGLEIIRAASLTGELTRPGMNELARQLLAETE